MSRPPFWKKLFSALPERVAAQQIARPWAFVIGATLLSLASIPLIYGLPGVSDGLTLNSDFTAMLPSHAPSVRDLDEIQRRFGGQQALMLTIEASDEEGLHRFVRDLAPRLEALDELKVVAVDWNVSDFVSFVEQNRYLYAELADLESIRDVVRERIDYERARANPFFLDLEDEQPPPDPEATIRRVERQARAERDRVERRYPGGFLQHPERPLVLLVVHTQIRGGATEDVEALLTALDREVAALSPSTYAPDIEIHRGGTLFEVREETASLVEAVRNSTIFTVVLVGLAIFIFFLRFRPIPLLNLNLIPPVFVTFAIAELTVDYLNASSAFLSSIVVGNGINPSIIWLARYFEERRKGATIAQAVAASHRGTWKGTLTASLAASIAYVSLMSTDYRGFRDFGIICGSGMVLCWLSAYLLLPALCVVTERWRPLDKGRLSNRQGIYGIVFARIALGSPRAVTVVATVLTLVTGGLVAWFIANDPMEYDFRRLRSERDPSSEVEYVREASMAVLDETMSGSALAVLAPSRAQAQRFVRELEARPPDTRAYGEVRSIDDLLPPDQEAKVRVARELRRAMLEIRPYVDDELQRTIDENLPPASIRALGPRDLPRSVARPFTERDGTRGRLLFLEHAPNESTWDGRYMARWAEAARSLRMDGVDQSPPVAGTAVVFSDLMQTIWEDGPRAVGIALVAVIALLIVTFRKQRERWLTLGSLLVGILWMAGAMALMGMRLNFLNFIAFPIAFGNGVDYAVNVVRRYADDVEKGADRRAAVRAAVESTGGAVILCSLTTVIGYVSLHTSSNQALNSFGMATAISEVTCLAAAVIALPAVLHLVSGRGAARHENG
jgi:predicted RND superfamily exporter protein